MSKTGDVFEAGEEEQRDLWVRVSRVGGWVGGWLESKLYSSFRHILHPPTHPPNQTQLTALNEVLLNNHKIVGDDGIVLGQPRNFRERAEKEVLPS